MNAQQLRNSILQEAIEGRLVPPACRQAGKTLTMNPQTYIKGQSCWFTYVIECEDGSFYKGFTDNLLRRYKQHCDGIGAEHTKRHKPKQLYYWEMHYSQEEALAREKYLKSGSGREWFQREVVEKADNWEPASVLLAKIRKEKEILVKEGKLKKKDLIETPINEEEIPFEIPESWEWVRLSDVIDVRDGTHDTPAYIPHGYPLITGKDFYNGYFDLSKTQYISESDYIEICKRSKVDIGDILFSMIGGNIGSQILISMENYFEMAIKNVALFKQFPSKNVDSKYLSVFLEARVDHIKSIALGGAQSFVSLKLLRTYLFPLPPLAEQKRIVAKIEELLPKVEEYGKAQDELNKLNEELPERLKKSILQEAIEGRLVPQDPNDEPASVLLDKIRKEKEQLVKEGKLKKKDLEEKPISEDEIPFEIPESWEWVRLGGLVSNQTGLSYKKDDLEKKVDNPIRVLRGGNIQNGSWCMKVDDVMIAPEYVKKPNLTLQKNTFITPAVTSLEHLGKTALIKEDHSDIVAGGFVLYLLPFYRDDIFSKFLSYYFQTAYYNTYCQSIANKSGQAFWNLSRQKLMELVLPTPPLAEQHRIVAKIEELFKEVDKMKK